MKLIIIILTIVAVGQAQASIFAQTVTLNRKSIPLVDVFREVKRQTGYTVFCKAEIIREAAKLSVNLKNVPLDEALEVILKPKGLSFKIEDRAIVVTKISRNTKLVNKADLSGIVNVEDERLQKRTVTGLVKETNGNPIQGVSVHLKDNESTASMSSADGRFSLQVPAGSNTLLFRHIGYMTEEVDVGDQTNNIEVTLKENVASLDEVVVGYAKQKKENLTGSVEVISPKMLSDRPASNTSQLLQGNVSGMNFTYSNYGAEPGAKLALSIRGQGSPLVLIDGVVGNINMINPADIESISVLKDAAASAIYGARAPYGVVLVTTKSGKNNQKVQVNFSANASFTDVINKPKMVDSYTFARAMNEMHDNQGVARLFSEETVLRIIDKINDPSLPETRPDPANPNKWLEYQYANGNNDWIDIHYGEGMRHQENLSISGGGEKSSFYVSAGHVYEKGPFRYGTDNYRRKNVNSRLDFNLTDWWTFSSNTRLFESIRKFPNGDNEGSYRTLIHHIIRTQPQDYLQSPNGYYSLRSRIPNVEGGIEHTIDRGLVQRFATEITPIKNWKINADYSVDFLYSDFNNIRPILYLDNVDGTLYPLPSTIPSSITKNKAHTNYQSFNIYSSYDWSIEQNHNFKLLAGFQHESNNYDWLQGARKDLITPIVPSITTATGEQTTSDDMTHWSTLGYFARLNYNYKEKYLLEANVRYDGTSKYARGNRWGQFPSFSAGWNVSNENFWNADISGYINSFKVRGSWGRLGNQNVDAYQDLALLDVNSRLSWIIDGDRPPYVTGPNLINPALTWETSETFNLGFDLGFLENRLQAVFDIYQRMTFNKLGPAEALPAVLGASIPRKNNAELKTRGWDLSLSWKDSPSTDFSYSVTAMLFDYTNTYTKYNNPTGILSTTYEGMKDGEIWGYESIGLIQTQEQADEINSSGRQKFISGQEWRTGDVMYADLDGNGVVDKGNNTVGNSGDWKIIGNSTPRYQFGLNLTAAWKGFDMRVFLQGTAKRDYWLDGNVFWGFRQWNQSSLFEHHMDYYRDTEGDLYSGLGINTDAYFPRPYSNATTDGKNKQQQTRYLQDGSYIRLKNLQLGYTFPTSRLRNISIQNMRVYVTGENLWTRTTLSPGFDPETADMGELGDGKSMFTQAVYAIGLSVPF